MINNYGLMRFRSEFNKLTMFYASKAKKLKHAPKIVARLNDLDLNDIKT